MKGKIENSEIFHDVSYEEYHEIVKMYATIIVTIWGSFQRYISELNHLVEQQSITPERRVELIKTSFHKTRDYLSNLLIEQFYNTGDENLFDASLMLNEKVNLEDFSTIDLNAVEKEEGNEKSFLIFYEGIFLTIKGDQNNKHHHFKIIVRNEKEVLKINKKLNRSRQILEIDEVTLGKKYYDGLCHRSHYRT